MAIELALEDDLFFADLNRQISLLIDEDDDDYNYPITHFPSISPQGFSGTRVHLHHHPPIMGSHSQYNLYLESSRRSSEIISKGTGVFIPQSSQSRRKYKQGKRSTHSYSAKSNNKQLNYSNNGKTNANIHTNLSPFYTNTTINRY